MAGKNVGAMAPLRPRQLRRESTRVRGTTGRAATRREPAAGSRSGPPSERALLLAAQRGGVRERGELVDSFLPLIGSVARIYRRTTRVEREELIQAGVVGLLRALDRYDADRGVPFWAYAAWWVRQAMQEVVSELSGPLVLSDRALRQLARVKAAQRKVEQSRGRSATLRELAAVAGLPESQVGSLISAQLRPRSLDEPSNDERSDAMSVGELVRDPSAEDAFAEAPNRACASELPRLLERLTERERTVICSRYGVGHPEQTLHELAGRLGVTAERVRQIEHASLNKLRAAVESA